MALVRYGLRGPCQPEEVTEDRPSPSIFPIKIYWDSASLRGDLKQETDGSQAEQLESVPVDRYFQIRIMAGAGRSRVRFAQKIKGPHTSHS